MASWLQPHAIYPHFFGTEVAIPDPPLASSPSPGELCQKGTTRLRLLLTPYLPPGKESLIKPTKNKFEKNLPRKMKIRLFAFVASFARRGTWPFTIIWDQSTTTTTFGRPESSVQRARKEGDPPSRIMLALPQLSPHIHQPPCHSGDEARRERWACCCTLSLCRDLLSSRLLLSLLCPLLLLLVESRNVGEGNAGASIARPESHLSLRGRRASGGGRKVGIPAEPWNMSVPGKTSASAEGTDQPWNE